MKRKVAALTIAQHEPERLPKWIGHYRESGAFHPTDIYVLVHDWPAAFSVFEYDATNLVPVHNSESFSHSWLRDTVQDFQKFLLNSYEVVLVAEADELIVHERGLTTFIDEFLASPQAAARCRGAEIVDREGGPKYELSRWYDKTLIAKTPCLWSQGFHECNIQPYDTWPGLWLVHTHRQDYAACRHRHRETAARKWSASDVASGAGKHNRIQSDADFDEWFYRKDGPEVALSEAVLKQLPQ